MKTIATLTVFSFLLLCSSTAYADSFGSGLNTFDIEFVTIGNPGNADDTTGSPNPAGKVDYTYGMGKYEISEDMIDKANTLGGLGITHDNRGANKPASSVSWFEAAKFVNWLNGGTPAYKFDGSGNFQLWTPGDAGYNPNNLYRNSLAKYFLPSMDEWYKAAFYDPNLGVYYDYPTGSDLVPDGTDFAGDTDFQVVYWDGGANLDPNDITDVGVMSPYGTAGQGGNIHEWEETDLDLVNNSTSSKRGSRGGHWAGNNSGLKSSIRILHLPTTELGGLGFRIASTAVPEPTTSALALAATLCFLGRRRR